jgi:simple sugar transport system ATP-binding protein
MKLAINIEKITKTYPGVLANSDVSIDVRSGDIHAIVGENGAGKSTLMKILYGMVKA